jgi:hypothetical protein
VAAHGRDHPSSAAGKWGYYNPGKLATYTQHLWRGPPADHFLSLWWF